MAADHPVPHAVATGYVRPGGQDRGERAGWRLDVNRFTAELPDPGPQLAQAIHVGLGHGTVSLAEEERLHVPDRIVAADVPEKPSGERGVSAALEAFLHDEDVGTLVVCGDSSAGAGWAAPDDEHVNVGCGVRHQLPTPQSRASGMICSANMVIARRAASVGMPGGWK
jgi:hypothetical protein